MAGRQLHIKWYLVENRIPALIAAVEANARATVKAHADHIAADARARAPVQTGYLRSTIQSVSIEAGKEAQIIVSAEYAPFVEYGTYKMSARPFLNPALEADKMAYFADIGKGLIKF